MGDKQVKYNPDEKKHCDIAGLSDSNTIFKSLRPKQISNSEQKITKVTDAVENEYINAFWLNVKHTRCTELIFSENRGRRWL